METVSLWRSWRRRGPVLFGEVSGSKVIISHRHRFIFVKTVKTAGTSIEAYLNPFLGPDDVATPVYPPLERLEPRNYRGLFNPVPEVAARGLRAVPSAARDLARRKRFYNHLPAFKIRGRVGAAVWNRYFKFAVERNPWDKTVSYYSMRRERWDHSLTWTEFLDGDRHCRNLIHYVEPRQPSTVIVDRVLRFEHLDEELSEVMAHLGIPFPGALGVRAKSDYRRDRRPYPDWYDEEQRRRVGELFADEIRLHQYTFDESWQPPLAGPSD